MDVAANKREVQVRSIQEILQGMLDQGYYWPPVFSGRCVEVFEHGMNTFAFRHEASDAFRYGLTVGLHQQCGQEPLYVYLSWRREGEDSRLIITDTAASNNLSLINGVFQEHATDALSKVIEGLVEIVNRTTLKRYSEILTSTTEEPHHATRTLPKA